MAALSAAREYPATAPNRRGEATGRCTYETSEVAEQAVDDLHEAQLGPRKIHVVLAPRDASRQIKAEPAEDEAADDDGDEDIRDAPPPMMERDGATTRRGVGAERDRAPARRGGVQAQAAEELRTDPRTPDCGPYSRREFLECYGKEDGSAAWKEAGKLMGQDRASVF
eukprot:gene12700-5885_t